MDPKFYNSSPISLSDWKEDDQYIEIPTVFMKAGVFTGTDGAPKLKNAAALQSSAWEFVGRPITDGHIPGWPGSDVPALGFIASAQYRPEEQDIWGISKVDKTKLSPGQLAKLRAGIDGSPGYFVKTSNEAGMYQGKAYQGIELGPYRIAEYAFLFDRPGACTQKDGCGPYHNSSPAMAGNGDTKMATEDVPAMTPDEFKKVLNEGLEPLLSRIEALEQTAKTLNAAGASGMEKLEARLKALETREETRITTDQKGNFAKILNAGGLSELDKNYAEYAKDPAGWVISNTGKLQNAAPAPKDLNGKTLNQTLGTAVDDARAKAHAALSKVGESA